MRLTAARLREILNYDPTTGVFTQKLRTSGRVRVGDMAGTVRPNGYLIICIDGVCYRAHRLAWLYVHGEWPSDLIDHINMLASDNRIENLRLATKSQNLSNRSKQKNNKSGRKGVSYDKLNRKWRAVITKNYKQTNLGRFASREEASAAYAAAAKVLHGEFARTE